MSSNKEEVIGLMSDSFSSKFLTYWNGALKVLWENYKYLAEKII